MNRSGAIRAPRPGRRRFLHLGATFAVGTVLAACAAPTPTAAPPAPTPAPPSHQAAAAAAPPTPAAKPTDAPKPAVPTEPAAAAGKQEVIVTQGEELVSLDPAIASSIQSQNILIHLYDSLTYADAGGKLQPRLATEWKALDPKVWQFKLRQGVKFHNGEELDAAAVKFSLERVLNPNTKSPSRAKIAAIEKIDAPDKYTLNITTREATALLPWSLINFGGFILPPRAFGEKGVDAFARAPVGSGPYKFVEWVKDSRIVLEANPDYWGEKAKIRRIVWRPIKEAATRTAELKAGGVDLALQPSPNEFPGIESAAALRLIERPSLWSIYAGIDTLSAGPLQDKRVRQALNYAVDKAALIKSVMEGHGKVLPALGVPEAFGWDPALQPYAYDLDKAKALLKDASFPADLDVPFTTRQGTTLRDKEMAEAVVGFLNKAGVKAKLQVVEQAVWVQQGANWGRRGLWYGGWRGDYPDMDGFVYSLLQSKQSFSYYANPDLDKLILAGRATIDEAARKETYRQALKLIHDEAPLVFLFQQNDFYGARKSLQWQPKLDSIVELWGASFTA